MSKSIPKFKNEDEEQEFWSKHASSEYLNWKSAERVLFPNLKPSTKAISLCLPESLLDAIRQMANERDVPYQSLIKIFCRSELSRILNRAIYQMEAKLQPKEEFLLLGWGIPSSFGRDF